MTMLIHETFQRTVQGEGYNAGLVVDFIRLGGCSVGCSWCDTGYSNQSVPDGLTRRSIASLVDELQSRTCVISGGEPFQQATLPLLVDAIFKSGRNVCIETSGDRWLDVDPRCWITFSPKAHLKISEPDVRFWNRANEIKIVISSIDDIEFYKNKGYLEKSACPIYLQAEWEKRETIIPLIIKSIPNINTEIRLSVQTHKLIGVR